MPQNDTTIPVGLCQCGCGRPTTLAKKTSGKTGARKGEPLRFVHGHQSLKSPVEYVEADRGFAAGPCWIWQRAKDTKGYGTIVRNRRSYRAHRVVYERHRGPIPAGLELDHLCRVRDCVNPDHLEPVTRTVNVRRGAAPTIRVANTGVCLAGHQLVGDNVHIRPNGSPRCRACDAARARERRKRKALQAD